MDAITSGLHAVKDLAEPVYDVSAAYVQYVIERTDLPTWVEYSSAFEAFVTDFARSCQSSSYFFYLTLRPLAILGWILLEIFGRIGQILFQHLLAHAWTSAQKGAMQAKAGIVWFYLFQRSLSRNEVLGEIAIVTALVVGYYLRRWLKQQTYYARFMRWLGMKKRRLIRQYTILVNRIAKVSLLLAIMTPHATFWGIAVLLKLLLPRVLQWLAMDTYATSLISVCYPLACTIGWIHTQRNPTEHSQDVPEKPDASSKRDKIPTRSSARIANARAKETADRSTKDIPSYRKGTEAQRNRDRTKRYKPKENASSRRAPKEPGFFPKTKPITRVDHETIRTTAKLDTGTYWLQYWIVYTGFRVFSMTIVTVPIFGRIATKQPFLVTLAAEFRLFFFIWIFAMENLLQRSFDTKDELVAMALPLKMILTHLNPTVQSFHEQISTAVSPETWNSIVLTRSRQVLDVLVLVRFLSKERGEWLLHLIEEGRVLVVPSITLLMPGFITQLGVTYVRSILPMAKSLEVDTTEKDKKQMYLQYWTLNILVSGLLRWFSSLIWWIPFSTHAIYILWCYLSLPRVIAEFYDVFEMELVQFGLVAKPGHDSLDISQSRTIQLMKAMASKLPSASESEGWEEKPDRSSSVQESADTQDKENVERQQSSEAKEGDLPRKPDDVAEEKEESLPKRVLADKKCN